MRLSCGRFHPIRNTSRSFLRRDFQIFGKVIDVIRAAAEGDLEIVPLYSDPETGEETRMEMGGDIKYLNHEGIF